MTPSLQASDCNISSKKDILETADAAGSFKILEAALRAADLVDPLKGSGPLTVFAPTDQAFAKLPKGTLESLLKPKNKSKLQAILKYHVVSGKVGLSDALAAKNAETLQGDQVRISFKDGKLKVNAATLVNADINASNGIIHVIDSVLLPPEPKSDITSVAKKAGKFNTLLAAVEAAGLEKALIGDKPLTVFAPTDDAFKALPEGTVENLLKPENRDTLKSILTLHVVPGKVSAGDALNAKSAKSLNGGKLQFGIKNGTFEVNGVRIVTTDIQCDNGVIHVIDSVILPKETSKSPKASADPAEMIEAALNKGVPIFNHGNHGKCADIYQQTLTSLSKNPQVNCDIRKVLTMILTRAKQASCDTTRAWILRYGLDHAHTSMTRN